METSQNPSGVKPGESQRIRREVSSGASWAKQSLKKMWDRIEPWETSLRWPCSEHRAGLNVLQRCLQPSYDCVTTSAHSSAIQLQNPWAMADFKGLHVLFIRNHQQEDSCSLLLFQRKCKEVTTIFILNQMKTFLSCANAYAIITD